MPRLHPGSDLLAEYAGGSLPRPLQAVVAAHVARCASCSATMTGLDLAAGLLLTKADPAALPGGMMEDALRRLDHPMSPPAASGGTDPIREPGDMSDGSWLAPGFRMKVLMAQGDATLYQITLRPGRSFPHHRHDDRGVCLVVQGSMRYGEMVCGPGDFIEWSASPDARAGGTAMGRKLLVLWGAVQGRIELVGLVPRLMRFLARL